MVPLRLVKVRGPFISCHWSVFIYNTPLSYGAAQTGVATAKSPCGPYTFKSSFKPLGAESRDMGLYQEGKLTFLSTICAYTTPDTIDDGTAYLLYASDNNQNFKISKLDSNYYNVASQTGVISSLLLFYRIYGPF